MGQMTLSQLAWLCRFVWLKETTWNSKSRLRQKLPENMTGDIFRRKDVHPLFDRDCPPPPQYCKTNLWLRLLKRAVQKTTTADPNMILTQLCFVRGFLWKQKTLNQLQISQKKPHKPWTSLFTLLPQMMTTFSMVQDNVASVQTRLSFKMSMNLCFTCMRKKRDFNMTLTCWRPSWRLWLRFDLRCGTGKLQLLYITCLKGPLRAATLQCVPEVMMLSAHTHSSLLRFRQSAAGTIQVEICVTVQCNSGEAQNCN